ncbi:MAG: hypothetical protein PHQ23_02220 [Candidatus Wallbacteria bacterium]|nr:hypothetical protein [Candidatus Wallbacteria bacterium]
MLAGIKKGDAISLALFEVKYDRSLSLLDFSQLSGYLQVAKKIPLGVLLLIEKEDSGAMLSNDFDEIVRLELLPLEWKTTFTGAEDCATFKTGIASYTPNNGITWMKGSDTLKGIRGFEHLAELIMSQNR